ncbi:MAG: 5-formyltetrahydrofolate cyclo-ligase [Acidobacteriota bacterium]
MTKPELRSLYLEKRRQLSASDVAGRSGRIADYFFATTELSKIETLHTFLSIPKFHEVDTALIYERIWRECPRIITVTSRTGTDKDILDHAEFAADTAFIESKWGIREPSGEISIEPSAVDIVLVPLLCVDERGYRVGYGKGFYDRFLAKCRPDCVKIGLSLFAPIDAIDDLHDHDVALDRYITPAGLTVFE